ncbi:MAG: DUF7482 domain-containing protein [bacterium]
MALTAFGLAGLALVMLMFGLSFAVTTAREVVTRVADVGTTVVKRWGGRIMVGVGLWLILLSLGANFFARIFPVHPEVQGQMPGMERSSDPTPAVKGFYKGQQVQFIHTEASDPKVAAMLTRMMGPKVLVVPSLKEIPSRLLADVYVFTNGVKGEGPFGFQADVFDTAPGDAGYTPLRRVNLVSWKDSITARILRAAEDVQSASARGEVRVVRPQVVVNMPFLSWPGGQR